MILVFSPNYLPPPGKQQLVYVYEYLKKYLLYSLDLQNDILCNN